MKVTILIIAIIYSLLGALSYQAWIPKETLTVTQYIPFPVRVEVIKEIPVVEIQTIIQEVEKIKTEYVYREPREFGSLEEFRVWVAQNEVTSTREFGCVDDALEMQRKAFRDGYYLSTETLNENQPEGHEVVKAWIGNKEYAAEPTNSFVWQIGYKKE